MLSLSKVASASYYNKLQEEDYYWSRGHSQGQWAGRGAQALGLSGVVEPETLAWLFEGFSSDGQHALVRNAGSSQRCRAWDITTSVPKSVSVLWANADETTRSTLESIQAQAVDDTIAYLEEESAFIRTGAGGENRAHAGLVVAVFPHYTSRLLDPQMHSHLVTLNIGVEAERTNALYSPALFASKMAAGAVYRASLAYYLEQDLGVEVERQGDLFEVKGIAPELLQAFSSRRAVIEETLEARGWENNARAAAFVTLLSRPVRHEVAQEVLQSRWDRVSEVFHFGREEVEGLLHRVPPVPPQQATRHEVLDEAKKELASQGVFSDRDMVRALAACMPGQGLPVGAIRELRDELRRACTLLAGLSKTHDTQYVFAREHDAQDAHDLALTPGEWEVLRELDDELELDDETL